MSLSQFDDFDSIGGCYTPDSIEEDYTTILDQLDVCENLSDAKKAALVGELTQMQFIETGKWCLRSSGGLPHSVHPSEAEAIDAAASAHPQEDPQKYISKCMKLCNLSSLNTLSELSRLGQQYAHVREELLIVDGALLHLDTPMERKCRALSDYFTWDKGVCRCSRCPDVQVDHERTPISIRMTETVFGDNGPTAPHPLFHLSLAHMEDFVSLTDGWIHRCAYYPTGSHIQRVNTQQRIQGVMDLMRGTTPTRFMVPFNPQGYRSTLVDAVTMFYSKFNTLRSSMEKAWPLVEGALKNEYPITYLEVVNRCSWTTVLDYPPKAPPKPPPNAQDDIVKFCEDNYVNMDIFPQMTPRLEPSEADKQVASDGFKRSYLHPGAIVSNTEIVLPSPSHHGLSTEKSEPGTRSGSVYFHTPIQGIPEGMKLILGKLCDIQNLTTSGPFVTVASYLYVDPTCGNLFAVTKSHTPTILPGETIIPLPLVLQTMLKTKRLPWDLEGGPRNPIPANERLAALLLPAILQGMAGVTMSHRYMIWSVGNVGVTQSRVYIDSVTMDVSTLGNDQRGLSGFKSLLAMCLKGNVNYASTSFRAMSYGNKWALVLARVLNIKTRKDVFVAVRKYNVKLPSTMVVNPEKMFVVTKTTKIPPNLIICSRLRNATEPVRGVLPNATQMSAACETILEECEAVYRLLNRQVNPLVEAQIKPLPVPKVPKMRPLPQLAPTPLPIVPHETRVVNVDHPVPIPDRTPEEPMDDFLMELLGENIEHSQDIDFDLSATLESLISNIQETHIPTQDYDPVDFLMTDTNLSSGSSHEQMDYASGTEWVGDMTNLPVIPSSMLANAIPFPMDPFLFTPPLPPSSPKKKLKTIHGPSENSDSGTTPPSGYENVMMPPIPKAKQRGPPRARSKKEILPKPFAKKVDRPERASPPPSYYNVASFASYGTIFDDAAAPKNDTVVPQGKKGHCRADNNMPVPLTNVPMPNMETLMQYFNKQDRNCRLISKAFNRYIGSVWKPQHGSKGRCYYEHKTSNLDLKEPYTRLADDTFTTALVHDPKDEKYAAFVQWTEDGAQCNSLSYLICRGDVATDLFLSASSEIHTYNAKLCIRIDVFKGIPIGQTLMKGGFQVYRDAMNLLPSKHLPYVYTVLFGDKKMGCEKAYKQKVVAFTTRMGVPLVGVSVGSGPTSTFYYLCKALIRTVAAVRERGFNVGFIHPKNLWVKHDTSPTAGNDVNVLGVYIVDIVTQWLENYLLNNSLTWTGDNGFILPPEWGEVPATGVPAHLMSEASDVYCLGLVLYYFNSPGAVAEKLNHLLQLTLHPNPQTRPTLDTLVEAFGVTKETPYTPCILGEGSGSGLAPIKMSLSKSAFPSMVQMMRLGTTELISA
nr:tegument-associated protein [Salmonid herpesvirus 1]